MKTKYINRLDVILTFLMSLLFISMALREYRVKFDHIYELTFLSNFIAGVFLGAAGILKCFGRKVPQVLYLDFAVLLMIVFGVTSLFSGHFTLDGAMLYLHAIDPIVLLAYYFLFSNQVDTKPKAVLTAFAMPLAYLIFAVLFGQATGKYIYFFLDYKWYGLDYTISFVAGIAVGTILFSFLLWFLNRLFHNPRQKHHHCVETESLKK